MVSLSQNRKICSNPVAKESELIAGATAHEEYTEEQLAKHRELTEQMYLCTPYIKAQMEMRKRVSLEPSTWPPTHSAEPRHALFPLHSNAVGPNASLCR